MTTWAIPAAALAGVLSVPVLRWYNRGAWRRDEERSPFRIHPIPMVLLLTASATITTWALTRPGWTPAVIASLVFLLLGARCALVDLTVHRIPEPVVLTLQASIAVVLLAGAALTGQWADLGRAVAAGVATWVALFLFALATGGIGFGDIQLISAGTLALGWAGWGPALAVPVLSIMVGGVWALALLSRGRKDAFPMGPSIWIGFVLAAAATPALVEGLSMGLAAALAVGGAGGRQWIDTTEAARLAGIKPDTLRHYVRTGHAPAPTRFGRSLMWDADEIRQWIATRPGQGARTDLRPHRVRLSRAVGSRLPANTVSVAAPTRWANPYRPTARSVEANQIAVAQFTEYLRTRPELVEAARAALRGRNLACWCAEDLPCHADVWLDLVNEPVIGGGER